jgi:2-phospho-L-lactate transferase/gluconeogenesis factor (CofD/UPF0052 family)
MPVDSMLKVVVFSGGRGSEVLSRELLRNPKVALTLAINGYDDGASTGEVRRFLGDALGPSDFRKNASRLARELQTCPADLVELLDKRLPVGCTQAEALDYLRAMTGGDAASMGRANAITSLFAGLDAASREDVGVRLAEFARELESTGKAFDFSDCSIGNLVFAGSFLHQRRDFNAAVADYCAMLRVPAGMIENVTDGANAYLVAVDSKGQLLGSEADIVDGATQRGLRDIFLLDRPIGAEECARLNAGPADGIDSLLRQSAAKLEPNTELLQRLAEADLIISAPGTQHSSLFPSYLTPGIGRTIAANLTAIKLLITNIRPDAEIGDSSAVDIVDRAAYFLREKGQNADIPTPCLITHYLINDPGQSEQGRPYVPLGRLDQLEDPRLVRIGNYEDGVSGRHDATTVITPFVTALLNRDRKPNLAVLLLESASLNVITQSLLEMLRGGIDKVPVSITAFYDSAESLDPAFISALPFELRNIHGAGFEDVLEDPRFEFVLRFESSGMYSGEDIVNVASLLTPGGVDAVWGSRRLSLSDIRESYRIRYRHTVLFGSVSYIGSHLLSLAYLMMYGRYVSDTLSGVWAVRSSCLRGSGIDLWARQLNHEVLSALLSRGAGVFETPVRFFPISPKRVHRTTVMDGLRSLGTILRWKLRGGERDRGQEARSGGEARKVASAR